PQQPDRLSQPNSLLIDSVPASVIHPELPIYPACSKVSRTAIVGIVGMAAQCYGSCGSRRSCRPLPYTLQVLYRFKMKRPLVALWLRSDSKQDARPQI